MRLHQSFGYGQSQAHTRRVAIYAHKILKNLLMVLRRNPAAGVCDADLYAVWPRQSKSASLLIGRNLRNAAFPKMWPGNEHHIAAAWRVFQGVVEQVVGRLLYLLIVETK